ncbi:MAG: EamA/RhaT family transporter, partial [Paracoccaceae bacterium]
MSENQKTVKAIAILLVGLLCFDIMILEVRYLLENYSAPELSAYRNVFGILPSLLVMLYTGELQFRKKSLALRQWKLAFLRGAIVAVAQLTFY